VITAWILLGVAAVLVVGNAVFVAAETALVTVDRNLVESRASEGSVRFGRVRGTLQRLSTYLSGAQLGITVTSLAIGWVAEPVEERLAAVDQLLADGKIMPEEHAQQRTRILNEL
jgi:CBS domain containing-hemolysin-like protein